MNARGDARGHHGHERSRNARATHEPEGLADRFEAHRGHLRAVAHRMLGSLSEAENAVQEAAYRPDADVLRQREVVGSFLAAARSGDFDALVTVLDPELVLRSDVGAPASGSPGGSSARRTWPGRSCRSGSWRRPPSRYW